MTGPTYDADRWLSPTERASLAKAIAADRANTEQPTRDTCQRCAGQGCEQCTGPRDQYVPEYVRLSMKKWSKAI